ncbi:MAG TPA: site-specific integrase [Candidatus Acidoferrum sp.]|jgi:integrase
MSTKRERGEGGLFRMKGSRNWYGQWYQNGKQVRVSLKTDVKEKAKRELRRKMGDAERGAAPENETRKLRYGNLRQALLDDYTRRGNKSLQVLSDGKETIWGLAPLDKYFGFSEKEQGIHVNAITVDKIRDFIRTRQKDEIGNAAINRSLALLRRMFNIARMDGKIQFMPAVRLLKEPPARKGFLARAQFEHLLSKLPAHLRPLVTFLYYCGVRVGEATQIEWGQVNLQGGLIRLEVEQTKTSEARIVPLPDVLIQVIKRVRKKEGLVFSDAHLREEWTRATIAAEMPGLLVHDLRRSAIRNLIAAGVPEKVAMSISGHKTRAVFDRYNIVDATDVVKAMSRLQDKQLAESKNGESLVRLLTDGKPVADVTS